MLLRRVLQSVVQPSASTSGVAVLQPVVAGTESVSTSDAFAPSSFLSLVTKRWAMKRQGGSTRNSKDSEPKHLGVKIYHGQLIFPGQIITRQRGTTMHPGFNVGMGKDHTLFSTSVGFVNFRHETIQTTRRIRRDRLYADVRPLNGEWEGEDYKLKVEAMVEARNRIKRELLSPGPRFAERLAAAAAPRPPLQPGVKP